MKKIMSLSIMAVAGFLFAQSAVAADAKVGFIDVAKLLKESTAVQGVMMQREKAVAEFVADFKEMETSLMKKEKAIADSEKKLTRAELGKKIDELGQDKAEYQNKAQKIDALLKANTDEVMREFQTQAVNPVVKKIAKERGFESILNLNMAVYVDPDVDVTDEAIAKINKAMPKIDFPEIDLSSSSKAEKKPVASKSEASPKNKAETKKVSKKK